MRVWRECAAGRPVFLADPYDLAAPPWAGDNTMNCKTLQRLERAAFEAARALGTIALAAVVGSWITGG